MSAQRIPPGRSKLCDESKPETMTINNENHCPLAAVCDEAIVADEMAWMFWSLRRAPKNATEDPYAEMRRMRA
jgi:hypothetical protein